MVLRALSEAPRSCGGKIQAEGGGKNPAVPNSRRVQVLLTAVCRRKLRVLREAPRSVRARRRGKFAARGRGQFLQFPADCQLPPDIQQLLEF